MATKSKNIHTTLIGRRVTMNFPGWNSEQLRGERELLDRANELRGEMETLPLDEQKAFLDEHKTEMFFSPNQDFCRWFGDTGEICNVYMKDGAPVYDVLIDATGQLAEGVYGMYFTADDNEKKEPEQD